MNHYVVRALVTGFLVASNAHLPIAHSLDVADVKPIIEKGRCLDCHGPGPNQRGPSFHAIALRYNDDASKYYLNVVTVDSLGQLPHEQRSQVIVARIQDTTHLRVFDKGGRMVVDQAMNSSNPSLETLVRQFEGQQAGIETKQSLLNAVVESVGHARSWHRESLVEKVKRGGKGNWDHGVPMPGFENRLSDAEIRQLVDLILQTAQLKIMKQGLGSGTVRSDSGEINCRNSCDHGFQSPVPVTLTATPDPGSRFVRWEGDATGESPTITVTMDMDRSVRAWFELEREIPEIRDFTPSGISDYLAANLGVNTPSRFLNALPDQFRDNWILMSRSESLQTGTAERPRILLPGADARFVFTIGTAPHSSYPGADPNAIEYMQWDGVEKNFRFHEIVLSDIPEISVTLPDGTTRPTFPARMRGVVQDDRKCFKCHSTQNVFNDSSSPGTTGTTPGTVKFKSKPNWDAYDSWGGMLPFNRDRIYQGSVEAAAFRHIFNPWNWRADEPTREILEQLRLQPQAGVSDEDRINSNPGGLYDGYLEFDFDGPFPTLTEPPPATNPITPFDNGFTNYAFNARVGTGERSEYVRHGKRVKLQDSNSPIGTEGRGVEFFDILGGLDGEMIDDVRMPFNAQRIVDELIDHRNSTLRIDVRPLVLAIVKGTNGGLFRIDHDAATVTSTPSHNIDLAFFNARNGMTITELYEDTFRRAKGLPRRKADIQKINLDRTVDSYLSTINGGAADGLIQKYGNTTSAGQCIELPRLRQEVFRRPTIAGSPDSRPDQSEMQGMSVDRENHGNIPFDNTEYLTLFRYFLEPLGVSVDKWSMGVRGRSRTYTFADVLPSYTATFQNRLVSSLTCDPFPGLSDPNDDAQLIDAVNRSLAALPPVNEVPTFVEVQRIFNKSCIECHGGLNYPPYSNSLGTLDLSEDEQPPSGDSRLERAHRWASALATRINSRITRDETLPGHMPFEGPALSTVDVKTFQRWKDGDTPEIFGASHIRTVAGIEYDLHSAGEFIMLRDLDIELQVRLTPVETSSPSEPDPYTGLSSWISVPTAVALRIQKNRVTYQPVLQSGANPSGLELRIDEQLVELGNTPLPLSSGGRIMRTSAPNGLQVETAGGSVIVITPGWWEHRKLWFFNIATRQARATQGLMGSIARGSWLPALPDGSSLGAFPEDRAQRYDVLHGKLAAAWRVTDQTSLFDYAEGMSTRSFTNEQWPGKQLDRSPKVSDIAPQAALPEADATELGRDIANLSARAKVTSDVRVTGESQFAKTQLLAEQIVRNAPPTAPVLLSPADESKELGSSVEFRWESSTDPDGDAVTYRHYVWPVDVFPNDNNAQPVRRSVSQIQSKTSTQLVPGKSYFWKVIAEDGKGRSQESETRRFDVKK